MIMRELAQMIQHEIGDPRVGLVTISHVDVTADLKYARVLVTRLDNTDSEEVKAQCIEGLTRAAGFLRKHLAKRVDLRAMPELRFEYDRTLENGFHMDELIAKANATNQDD
jgi:ribosome-binding factor A